MQQTRDRASYIDAVKGVAILCITFLHFEGGVIPWWLNEWMGMFMISTFYFTSGWITGTQNRNITTKELFKKRIKQLGIPYLWFSLLIIALDIILVMTGYMEKQILLREIFKTITLRGIGTLWFLPVLILGETIFCYIRNHKYKWFVGVCGAIFTVLIGHCYFNIWAPIRAEDTFYKIIDSFIQPIARGITSWPIIAIGYLFSKYAWHRLISFRNYALTIIGIAILAFSILLIIAPPFKIYYINGVLSNFLPALGFIILFYIFDSKNYISRFFIYWGVNSLVLMCTHYSITEELIRIFNEKILHREFYGWITIVYFIITIILTYPIVNLFNKRLRFMLGKK